MSIFAEDMAEEFGLFEECQGERPSADTFERVMSIIKPEEMQRCLKENGIALVGSLKKKHVAIDGKKLKGSNPKAKGNKGCYLLNAFVTENRLTLNQMMVGDKENEIVAIPNQLHWNLDVLFKEDACRARRGYAGMNLSAIRKLALQGIKEHKDGLSLRKKVYKASLNKEYMRKLLADFKF